MSTSSTQPAATKMGNHRKDKLAEAVAQLKILPSTLAVPMRLLELQRDRNSTMAQFAAAISTDSALVAKILGLVNSAAFTPARPVTRVSQALTMIGLKNLLPLVFGTSLGGIHNQFSMPAEEGGALWKAALLKSVVAREYAKVTAPDLAEEAMIIALLQDVSLPLFYAVDRSVWTEMQSVLEMTDCASREAREERLYGNDHAQVAASVAERLGLPARIGAATAAHHRGDLELEVAIGDRGLSRALALAARFPHRINRNNPSLRTDLATALRSIDGGGAIDASELWLRISSSYQTTVNQLGEPDDRGGAFKPFMQALCGEVAACLESAIGHATQVITELEDQRVELEKNVADLRQQIVKSEFDVLTEVYNRKGFLRRAEKLAAMAASHGASAIIGFVDLDDFKQINDTHGHDAGDRALIAVAQRLAALVAKNGIVGRLGGDEFAFVAFAPESSGIARIIETISSQMCRFQATSDDGPLQLSCSIGVGRLDGPGVGPLEESLRRADESMYVAKRGGKGRCNQAAESPTADRSPAVTVPK